MRRYLQRRRQQRQTVGAGTWCSEEVPSGVWQRIWLALLQRGTETEAAARERRGVAELVGLEMPLGADAHARQRSC